MFGSYWSLALVIGFGAFLPVELELARLLNVRRPGSRPLPCGAGGGISLAGLTAGAGARRAARLGRRAGARPRRAPRLPRRPARGVRGLPRPVPAARAAARHRPAGRARHGVLLVDSGLRVVFAAGGWCWCPMADAADYAWTLVAAMALAHLPYLLVALHRGGRPARAGRPMTRPVRSPRRSAICWSARCAPRCCSTPPRCSSPRSPTATSRWCGRPVRRVLHAGPAAVVRGRAAAERPDPRCSPVSRPRGTPPSPWRRSAGGGWGGRHRRAQPCSVRLIGLFLGPALVSLVFGERYALPGTEGIALLAVGSALHLGLLVASQTLVASARHRAGVAVVWVAGAGRRRRPGGRGRPRPGAADGPRLHRRLRCGARLSPP